MPFRHIWDTFEIAQIRSCKFTSWHRPNRKQKEIGKDMVLKAEYYCQVTINIPRNNAITSAEL